MNSTLGADAGRCSVDRPVGHCISWFSAGVSSAVATRMAIEEIDQIIYTHIDDQHPDTMRFVRECEEWFGKPITILQNATPQVETIVRKDRYIGGVAGAPCTKHLKRRVRQRWEQANFELYPMTYFWGMDAGEAHRADRVRETMPEFKHRFPLIEKRIGKAEAHEILRASGIKRPAMYELGYHNNNCVGCVKGGKGYWNKIRVDFPQVFAARAKLEREIGASCINGVFLDELDPQSGRHEGPIVDECGLLCEMQAIPLANIGIGGTDTTDRESSKLL
jgi:hypothetical protein